MLPAHLKDFLPYHISEKIPAGKISWIKNDRESLTDPFFADTIRKLKSSHAEEAETGISVLLESDLKNIAPAGFIFHVSRCGSTLLSNALKNTDNSIVIAEADTINTALLSILKAGTQNAAIEQLLTSLVNWYGKNDSKKLFIKFSSWNTLLINTIQKRWPDTPVVFSFRDPHAVIQSLLKKRAGWFGLYNDPLLKSRLAGDADSSFIHFLISMVKATFENGSKASNAIFLDYSDHKLDNIRRMLDHFHLQPSGNEWLMIQESSEIYSKDNRQQTIFQPRETDSFELPTGIITRINNEIMPIYKGLQTIK